MSHSEQIVAGPDDAEREFAELQAHVNAATHRQLVLIRYIDEDGLWYRQGSTSCAAWLAWRTDIGAGAARERVRVARALAALPRIDDALGRGALSFSKVRAMTRVATAANEEHLLEIARYSTATQLEKICRMLRRVEAENNPDTVLERYVRVRDRGDGTVLFEAVLSPDEGSRLMEALRVLRATLSGSDLCDALVRLADGARAELAAVETRTGADRADVVVHLAPSTIDGSHAVTLDDGTRVSAATFRRVACDCGVIGVREDERGEVLDVGRKTRSIPAALRRAVMLRHPTCAFPGCTHDRFVDIHHCEHWIDGGETKLGNLLPLCTYHHRFLHEGGWRVSLHEGMPCFAEPTGADFPSMPRRHDAPHDPLAAFGDRHAALSIDDETCLSRWDGSRPDYAECVQQLLSASEIEESMTIGEWLAEHPDAA
jgi:hypothetical protein